MDFILRKSERDEQLLVMEGTSGFQRDVKLLSSLEEAWNFIQSHKPNEKRIYPAMLIPNNEWADAIGFDLRYTKKDSSGELGVSEKYLRIVCSDL